MGRFYHLLGGYRLVGGTSQSKHKKSPQPWDYGESLGDSPGYGVKLAIAVNRSNGMTNTPELIEQQLREAFPFARQWLFRCTDGRAYYLQSEQATIALNCHSPHGVFAASWGAKLTTENSPWTLAANEGATPAEAIANLQQAISQVVTLAEYSSTVAALDTFRQYSEAALELEARSKP